MSVSLALPGLLQPGPIHGYDLKRDYDIRFGRGKPLRYSQVYDPALRVSFGYASEHALAQAAKAIITAYYGKPPAYSYYNGCSDGEHEALAEAQRYPHDFNGILAGAPGDIEAQLLGVVPAWLIAINTGADGREILTSEKLPALHAAVIKACGNAQGLIEDPRSCGFNPATIQCPAGAGALNSAG